MNRNVLDAGKKDQILKVAQDLFAKFGLSKTTIEDIAKSMRMAKASIYYYFKNKEAIYEEVIKKEGEEVKREITKAVDKATTAKEKLRTYILSRINVFKKMANYYTVFKEEYLNNYRFVVEARDRYTDFELNLIKNILKFGIENGEFEIENPDLTAEAILVAMKGFEYHWTFDIPDDQIEHNLDILLNVLYKGIEKR